MAVHGKNIIDRLEEYRYDCLLYANICDEIEIFREKLKTPSEFDYELLQIEIDKVKDSGYIKKYSERAREITYNEHVRKLFGSDTLVTPEERVDAIRVLRQLSSKRNIVRRRINQIDNAMKALSKRERDIIFRCVINRSEDDYMLLIADEFYFSPSYLYQLRDSGLTKLEIALGMRQTKRTGRAETGVNEE